MSSLCYFPQKTAGISANLAKGFSLIFDDTSAMPIPVSNMNGIILNAFSFKQG
jgi:hypothetical protein